MVVFMKKISNTLIIPPGSVERFLSFGPAGATSYSGGDVCGGISMPLKKGYKVAYRRRSAHELIFILQGGMTFHWEGLDIDASEGDCVFLPSGLSPHEYGAEHQDAGILWFHIRRLPEYGNAKPELPVRPFRRKSVFLREIAMLAELLHLQEQHADAAGADSAAMLKQYLFRELGKAPEESSDARSRLDKAYGPVWNAPGKNWRTQKLARVCCLSPSHFHALTRQVYDRTPGEMIRKIRMSVALPLLLRSDMKLENIARHVGYANAFSFAKAFRKEYGESPGRYRRAPHPGKAVSV